MNAQSNLLAFASVTTYNRNQLDFKYAMFIIVSFSFHHYWVLVEVSPLESEKEVHLTLRLLAHIVVLLIPPDLNKILKRMHEY